MAILTADRRERGGRGILTADRMERGDGGAFLIADRR